MGNLCGTQREFRFQPKERCFLPYEEKKKNGNMKVFDGSSIFGSGSFFQAPSLSGPMTCQEQGSPDSPQVFSVSAPKASGHDEFQQALKDPEFAKAVRGLELCLRVRERERLRDSGTDTCRVSHAGRPNIAECGGEFASGSGDLVSCALPSAFGEVGCASGGGVRGGCSSTAVVSARSARASQAAMTKLHAEEKDAFAINKRELEDGIVAVRSTRGVLRDYGRSRHSSCDCR